MLNKILVLAGYFMHYRMCLLGNFNILVYEGDKMQNKKIPLLCPRVRGVFLPSIVLSNNNQPQPKTHSSHTMHAQQINTHLSLQAAKARLRFAWKQCQGRYRAGIEPSTFMLCSSRAVNTTAARRFLTCNLLNFACCSLNKSIDWEPTF